MIAKAITFCHCEGMTRTESVSTMAMTKLARRAPARLPRPPRIVIAKALIVNAKPTVG
jgi:hypothetical protein